MIYLSQRSPLWTNVKMGKSNLTIGEYGCTTTCISMLSDYFKCFVSPKDLAQGIQGYDANGLVIWEKLKLPMKFEKRLHEYNPDEIAISLKDPKKAVILEFQLPGTKHWCVALSKVPLAANTYFIADPWTGSRKTSLAYKNAIVGSAHYVLP